MFFYVVSLIHNGIELCQTTENTHAVENESQFFLIKGRNVLPCCTTQSVTEIKTAVHSEKAILESLTRLLNPVK